MPKILLVFIILSSLIVSCNYFGEDAQPEKDLLAVVGENQLYLEDIKNAIPSGLDSSEQVRYTKGLIKQWVEEQAILQRAELNLSSEKKDFEKQIEKFRASLIIYAYEQEYVRQKLDTTVSDKEIKDYYDQKPENFQLKDYVLKARFLKVDEKAPKLNKIRKWIESEDAEEVLKLEEYCLQYASTFLVEDKWIKLSNLIDVIPIEIIDPQAFLVNTKFKEVYSPPFRFFMYVYDYRLINTQSPLQIEREKIINAIINERRMKLLKTMREGIVAEALNNKEAQLITP